MIRSARRSVWAARPRAAAVTVLATLMVLLPTPPGSSAGSPDEATDEAGPPDGQVRVVLDAVEPAVPQVGEPVTFRGRVVNDGPARRRLTTVEVRSAWTPLAHRADVTHWLEGRDQRETGWVLGEDSVGPVVVPGAEVPFSVQVPENGLDALPGDLAALALEIEVTGELDPGAGDAPAGDPEPVVLRTVLAAARSSAVLDPLDVSWVVPLTLPADPSLTARADERRHEAWLSATGPGSPARTWLENLTVDGVTWMVDPAMLVPVAPADDLAPEPAPAEEEPDGEQPTGEQPAGEPTPDAPDGSSSTAGPVDESGTTAPGDPPAGTDQEAPAPTGEDGAVTTAEPSPPAGTADDAGATTAAPEGPDRGLDDGEELGGRPGGDASGPATAEEVEEGLVALRGLLARSPAQQLWWTPPADPDVAALLAQPAGATVATALDLPLAEAPAQAERLLRRGRSDVAWPALSAPTADDVVALDRSWATRPATPEGVAAVIVPRESLSGGSNTSVDAAAARVGGVEGVTALGADTRAAALLAGARGDAAQVGEGAVVQRLLADSLTAYQQEPLAGRSMLYAPPRGSQVPGGVLAGLAEGFRAAPWARSIAAADLLATAARSEPVALSGVAPAPEVLGGVLVDRVVPPPSQLDAASVRALVGLEASLAGLTQVLADTAAVSTWDPVISHLWSSRWRGSPDAWQEARQEARRPVSQAQEGVHVNPSTVNFLSDQGIMQVTVVNDLPVAVEGVQVELVPERSLLRVVEQPEPISIGAESRATVSFTARAVTRGVTTVSARLTTPNGTVLGDDAQVSVRVQPTGVWIYWVLGSVAGLLLVLGLVRTRRTAPRSAAVAASTSTTGTTGTTPEENG